MVRWGKLLHQNLAPRKTSILKALSNKVLEKYAALAEQEGQLLRRLNLNPNILIEMMRRLEKVLPPNKVKLILTLNGREYVLEDDQNADEDLRAVIEKELKRGELKKISLSRENRMAMPFIFQVRNARAVWCQRHCYLCLSSGSKRIKETL